MNQQQIQQFLNNIIAQNPQARSILQQAKVSGSMENFARQLAKQYGVDIDKLLQQYGVDIYRLLQQYGVRR